MRWLFIFLTLALSSVLGAARTGLPTWICKVDTVQVSPDTMALDYGDDGIFTVRQANKWGAPCSSPLLRVLIRDTTKVRPVAGTLGPAFVVTPKATGTTWFIAHSLTDKLDSGKIVVTSGPPAPNPPTVLESLFVASLPETLTIDSGTTGTLTARTYRNAGLTDELTGRAMSVSSTAPAVASVAPTSGTSVYTVTVTGVTPGTAKAVVVPTAPGKRDTSVVIVNAVGGSPPPGDPTGVLAAQADSFVDAISVQTHLTYSSYSSKWSTVVRPRLLELGVRHVRERMFNDAAAQSRMQDLAANGVKLTDREANPEKVAERQRRYYAANRERVAEQQRRYYAANREKVAEQQRRYREANPEKVAERRRRYREANRDPLQPVCGTCGTALRYGGRGRPPKWCEAHRPLRGARTEVAA